jgi:hypothetical protein
MNSDALVVLFGIEFGGRLADLDLDLIDVVEGECWQLDGPVSNLYKGVIGRTDDNLARFLNVLDRGSAELDMVDIFTGTVIFDNSASTPTVTIISRAEGMGAPLVVVTSGELSRGMIDPAPDKTGIESAVRCMTMTRSPS